MNDSPEPQPQTPVRTPTPPSELGETLVPFGELLIQEGLVPREQVEHALELQESEARRGVFLRLGELLVAMGQLNEPAVAQVLGLQGRSILFCPQCLAQYNVLGDQRQRYRCKRCDQPLEEVGRVERLEVEDTIGPEALLAASGEERVFGPYVILGLISRGGMGIVYKARQRSLDRIVAMKVNQGQSEEERAAFAQEARAVARLRHPHVVAIHEVGRVQGVDYFTMDYVEGLPLDRAVAAEGLNQEEIVKLFVKVCDAIDYSHSEGILHHDIKPANVLVDRKHNPLVIDFGIARPMLGDGGGAQEEQAVGSPAYLPPEYLTGLGTYDVAGEVYALGATLYTALAGAPPHPGFDTAQIVRQAKVQEPVHLRKVRRSISRDLALIVMTAISREPGARYGSVREMANDLRRWLEGDEVAGRRTRFGRIWSRIRGRVAAALGLTISLLLLLVTLTYTLQIRELRREDQERMQQLDRERGAIYAQLVDAQLNLVEARMKQDPGRARRTLDRLLGTDYAGPYKGRIYELRARVNELRGDADGAARDRRMAREAGS